MAKGTSAGFFGKRKPPAVFKHALLQHYVAAYAGMVGSTNSQGRVVFLDGYAGEGRYEDQSPGSPMLAMNMALGMLPGRALECVFVEKDLKSFTSLEEVTATFKEQGVACEAIRGRVEDHLDAVVRQASGVPLFMFLDPCGVALPFARLVSVMTGPRAGTFPATEVLINFSDKAVRHIGGQLAPDAKDRSGLQSLDVACGGDWWPDAYLKASGASEAEAGVQAVVEGYAQYLREQTTSRVVPVPVRPRPDLLPIYHLVF
jgi:three-Cys-motif partner protein